METIIMSNNSQSDVGKLSKLPHAISPLLFIKQEIGRLLLSTIWPVRKIADVIAHKQVIIQQWAQMLIQGNIHQYFSKKQQLCQTYEQVIRDTAKWLLKKDFKKCPQSSI